MASQCLLMMALCVVLYSLSNIAIKINTKLSKTADKASSWLTDIDWIGKEPTLIIGIGTASGMGNSSETVVTASTLLDNHGMRLTHSCFVQGKSNDIADHVMGHIVEVRHCIIGTFIPYNSVNRGV